MESTLNNKGFTLIEVMIAVTLFGVFMTAFVVSQTGSINSSIQMQQGLTLLNLAESTINQAILDPPKFTNTTQNDIKEKNFEEEGLEQYKYRIEYKKIEFPDFNQILGQSEDQAAEQGNDALIQKTLFKKLKENIEKVLWQVEVTITDTLSGEQTSLSSWVTNDKARLDLNFGI